MKFVNRKLKPGTLFVMVGGLASLCATAVLAGSSGHPSVDPEVAKLRKAFREAGAMAAVFPDKPNKGTLYETYFYCRENSARDDEFKRTEFLMKLQKDPQGNLSLNFNNNQANESATLLANGSYIYSFRRTVEVPVILHESPSSDGKVGLPHYEVISRNQNFVSTFRLGKDGLVYVETRTGSGWQPDEDKDPTDLPSVEVPARKAVAYTACSKSVEIVNPRFEGARILSTISMGYDALDGICKGLGFKSVFKENYTSYDHGYVDYVGKFVSFDYSGNATHYSGDSSATPTRVIVLDKITCYP